MRLIAGTSVLVIALAFAFAFACGESRRSIGEECLRSEDCLSGYCAAKACVAAPPLVNGGPVAEPEQVRLDAGESGG